MKDCLFFHKFGFWAEKYDNKIMDRETEAQAVTS